MPVLEGLSAYPPLLHAVAHLGREAHRVEPSSRPHRPLGGLETTQRGDRVEPSSRPIARLGARRQPSCLVLYAACPSRVL